MSVVLVAAVAAVSGPARGSGVAAADTRPAAGKAAADGLGARDEGLLAAARANRQQSVQVVVATDDGRAKAVADGLRKLGADVARQVDRVGYLRAWLPTGAVAKAATLPGVTAIDLNEKIAPPAPEPVAKPGPAAAKRAPAPGPGTPAANPYLPTQDTGAVAFKQAHPEWDGRGVTVGLLDSGVDLDHPALHTTSTGERKVVDWFTATDPRYDATWRPMTTAVQGPTFTYAGVVWTAPAGTHRVNQFAEAITISAPAGGDVNRDGDTTDQFGVLYDPVSHDVRVDVNQNRDFTDDAVMRPYAEKFDVGHFGTDNPATAVREQLPFVVGYQVGGAPGGGDYVSIGITMTSHASHIAGIVAGADLFGNPNYDGVAPGAKLISGRACLANGCDSAGIVDGVVDLVTRRKVDVVSLSVGQLPALNDGDNATAELYNRLIAEYGIQIVSSAGNSGAGVNTVGEPSATSDVVSVAAGISKETWHANYGAVVSSKYSVFNFSSRGPREDGGFKPNLTAPGSAISTAPLWEAGSPVPEAGYPLPPGYQLWNGTSMAGPQVAGGIALLLSAAKATGRTVTPAALRRALYSSATWIPGAASYAQGNGLLDVNGSWRLLADGVQTRGYTAEAPVCTPQSASLPTPHRGPGIYNRCAAGAGGLAPGQVATYPVKLTRTSGPDEPIRHLLRWVGNDGTFSSAGAVEVPLNETVEVPVRVKAGVGVHGAHLEVDDPDTSTVDFELSNVVLVANDLKAAGGQFGAESAVGRSSFESYLVSVPVGASVLQLNLSDIATGSQTRFLAFSPDGLPVDSVLAADCYTNFSDPAVCKPQERQYANPLPGVWEITVDARRTSPALLNPYTLAAKVQGVTFSPSVVGTVENALTPMTVTAQGGPLTSAVIARPTISDQPLTFRIDVVAGTTRLDIAIGNAAQAAADLDLYLYRDGVFVDASAEVGSAESILRFNPAPGAYVLSVEPYEVPAGGTEFDYRDILSSPAFGTLAPPAGPLTLAHGGSVTVSGVLTAGAPPATGRKLRGELSLLNDKGRVVGRGTVLVGTGG